MSDKSVQIKEKYGNTINVAPIKFDGDSLYAPIPFKHLSDVMDNISKFESRPDDIWINSYVKSGKTYQC